MVYLKGYEWSAFLEKEMPKIIDATVPSGITAREHPVRKFGLNRIKWPFKGMVINDFCVIEAHDAVRAKNALKSFYKRFPGRRFSNRPTQIGATVHVIRRVS